MISHSEMAEDRRQSGRQFKVREQGKMITTEKAIKYIEKESGNGKSKGFE